MIKKNIENKIIKKRNKGINKKYKNEENYIKNNNLVYYLLIQRRKKMYYQILLNDYKMIERKLMKKEIYQKHKFIHQIKNQKKLIYIIRYYRNNYMF